VCKQMQDDQKNINFQPVADDGAMHYGGKPEWNSIFSNISAQNWEGRGQRRCSCQSSGQKKGLWAITIFLGSVTHVEGLYNINLLRSPNSTIRYNIPSPKQRHGLWDDKHTPAQSYGERRCHVWHAGPSEGPCGKDAD